MDSVRGRKIFVGLSGGVDSAVTAALLLEAGAQVHGVFIKGWYPPELPCTWAEDRRDAMRAAAHLGIPFHTLDASEEYKHSVIDYLIREYAAGRTPNPDIMCNRDVKFGAFFEFAMAQGADFIATGHYAQIKDGELLRGIDEGKDQSYFLWAIHKEVLTKTLFPLGGIRKSDVRELALKYKLPNAQKKDSQGICFLGPVSMDDFLRSELLNEPGKALTDSGEVVGTHDGVLLHTLGERIALESPLPGPWYVLRKDIPSNILIVGRDRVEESAPSALALSDLNWFGPIPESMIHAQFRYHGPLVLGTYDRPSSAFTPASPLLEPAASGQSLVLYDGDRVVGGGILS